MNIFKLEPIQIRAIVQIWKLKPIRSRASVKIKVLQLQGLGNL